MSVSSSVRRRAVGAAVAVGTTAGYEDAHAVIVGETKNVVVWLTPHPVVAKVGILPGGPERLAREVDVCAQLSRAGAPTATPIGGLAFDSASGLPVSLWQRLESLPGEGCSADDVGNMLHRVHVALRSCSVELPSFLAPIDHTRATLFDDAQMVRLPSRDLALLRAAFDHYDRAARESSAVYQPLHGEPHRGNVIVTANGPHLVDFESACHGPLEWDLALTHVDVSRTFDDVDRDLLAVLRMLNSARMAAWVWSGTDRRTMRSRGKRLLSRRWRGKHLDNVRRAFRS